jgi:hypothetical protein
MDGSLRKRAEFVVVATNGIMTRLPSGLKPNGCNAPDVSLKGRSSTFHSRWFLQRVHIREQILDLLVGHDPSEAFHFAASELDNFADAGIVCGKAA